MSNKSINLEPLAFRIAAIIVGGALITLLLLSANWFFANAIANATDITEIAVFSSDMAPSDPQTHIATALLLEQSFREEDQKAALKETEIAVSLSPSDYFLWQTLARLRERSGDIDGAEKALRKALELAPNYAAVQWALGNVLLRREKYSESFALIRKAVDGDPNFAGPAASIAWDIFEGDIGKIRGAIGNSNPSVSAFALFLARNKRLSEAYEIWRTLPKAERIGKFKTDSQSLMTELMTGKKFRLAVAVAADLVENKDLIPEVNAVTNGGFEYDTARELPDSFDWSIEKGTEPSIGLSVDEKLSGSKSITLLFGGGPSKEFRAVSQIVAVTSGRSFTFSAGYKSGLESNATLIWTISDLATGAILASTEPIAALSDGWQTVKAEFTVPEDSDGVVIKLARAPCSDTICPIRGAVWFDEIGIN